MLHVKIAGVLFLATALFSSSGASGSLGMLTGEEDGDQFGRSVAAAGDVDGDGFDDFLVGAPMARGGAGITGTVSLYLGNADSVFDVPAVTLEGEAAGDEFGYSVAAAGDVDGDGYDDFLIGAPSQDGTAFEAGRVYLYEGGPSGISLADFWDGDLAGSRFGASVSGGFDFDDDGYDDFAAGAPGSNEGATRAGLVKIYLGASSMAAITQPTAFRFVGDQANWALGWSLDAAGDVDGDNYDDVIAGAPQPYDLNSGRAIIWFGQSSAALVPARLVLSGEVASDRFGYSVSRAGDRDDDGYDDVIVGAPAHDSQGLDKGAVYLFRGGLTLNAIYDWRADGSVAGDSLGYAVAGGRDTDGDQIPEIVAGAPGADRPSGESGEIRLYYGSSHPSTLADTVYAPVVPAPGFESDDRLGASVALAGAITGGTHSAILAGAPNGNDASGTLTGYVDIFEGSPEPPVPVRLLSFTATGTGSGVELRWELEDAILLSGIRLSALQDGEETSLHSGWLDPATRQFVDMDPLHESTRYVMWGLTRSGDMLLLGYADLSLEPPQARLQLVENPFRQTLRLRASLPPGRGQIVVLDAAGRKMRRLWEGTSRGESIDLRWDGRDASGHRVAPGIYFLAMESGGASFTTKVIKLSQ